MDPDEVSHEQSYHVSFLRRLFEPVTWNNVKHDHDCQIRKILLNKIKPWVTSSSSSTTELRKHDDTIWSHGRQPQLYFPRLYGSCPYPTIEKEEQLYPTNTTTKPNLDHLVSDSDSFSPHATTASSSSTLHLPPTSVDGHATLPDTDETLVRYPTAQKKQQMVPKSPHPPAFPTNPYPLDSHLLEISTDKPSKPNLMTHWFASSSWQLQEPMDLRSPFPANSCTQGNELSQTPGNDTPRDWLAPSAWDVNTPNVVHHLLPLDSQVESMFSP